jgi:hypothetical protein
VGAAEVEIRDRAADSLVEIERLDVRRLFGGFGFYIDGLLVAAAWDGAFRLRYREDGHWVYRPVDDSAIDEPSVLVAQVRDRAAKLSQEPDARRPRRAGSATSPGP